MGGGEGGGLSLVTHRCVFYRYYRLHKKYQYIRSVFIHKGVPEKCHQKYQKIFNKKFLSSRWQFKNIKDSRTRYNVKAKVPLSTKLKFPGHTSQSDEETVADPNGSRSSVTTQLLPR